MKGDIRIKDHRGTLVQQALSFQRTTGLPLHELLDEAEHAFGRAVIGYRPGTTKFNTYLTTAVRNHLIHWCRRQQYRWDQRPLTEADIIVEDTTQKAAQLRQDLAELSEEAQCVARLVFCLPGEVVAKVRRSASDAGLKEALRRWLLKKGWSVEAVDGAFNELTELANSLA